MNSLSTGNALGTGLADSAKDIIRLRKVWQKQYMNGETQKQFKEWMKDQGNTSALPR